MKGTTRHADVIVIGSGIGDLASPAALARFGRQVRGFQKHTVGGGPIHTFEHQGLTWDMGVHHLGQVGPGQPIRRALDWFSGGRIDFSSMGSVYEVVHLGYGMRFEFARPRTALDAARRCANVPFQCRATPGWHGNALGCLEGNAVRRWWGRTASDRGTARVREAAALKCVA